MKLWSKLSTRQVIISGIFLALILLLSFINQELQIIIFPIVGFLKLEIVDFLFLVCCEIINPIWTTLIILLDCTIRLSFNYDPVGLLALFLADVIFVWSYFIIKYYLLKTVYNKKLNSKFQKNYPLSPYEYKKSILFWISLISVIFSIVITSLLITLLNYAFIYQVYILYLRLPKSAIKEFQHLWPWILGFNFIKYAINGFAFVLIEPILFVLKKRYNFSLY